MQRTYLLIVMAIGEGGTGLLLLALPSLPLVLLLGVDQASPEAILVARITGAALLAIGVACWLGRRDRPGPAQLGLIAGALVYGTAAAALLAYAGLVLRLAGIALWPAVVLHAAMGVWCIACMRAGPA
jgi:hypothetical protein